MSVTETAGAKADRLLRERHRLPGITPEQRARRGEIEAAICAAFEGAERAALLDRALNFFASASSLVPPPYDEDLEQQQLWVRMSAEKRTEARVEWALFEAAQGVKGDTQSDG